MIKRNKTSIILFVFFSFLLVMLWPQKSIANLKEYGIENVGEVKMSFRYEGAESPFQYASVEIQGDGKAICSFKYHGLSEQKKEFSLEKEFIEDLIKKHTKLDFFEFDFESITEKFMMDAGNNTLMYQYKGNQRAVTYSTIKTRIIGSSAVPATDECLQLRNLQSMYWKIISQAEYLFKLKNYNEDNLGEIANDFSILEDSARDGNLLDPKELVPAVMEIISKENLRKKVGQYAAPLLKQLTGASPPGDWWDCDKWIKWWQENKNDYEKY